MDYRPPIDPARLGAAIAFLQSLLTASASGERVDVDQDAARRTIATCLGLKDPRTPMHAEMYDAFTPHATNVAVEGVALRVNSGSGAIEVLLLPRPHDDPRYRTQLASPGQGVRPADEHPAAALERLSALEFRAPTRYEFVGDVYVTNGLRGWYECKVHLAFPERVPDEAVWCAADPLPPDSDTFRIVRSHRERIIPLAVEAFKARQRTSRRD